MSERRLMPVQLEVVKEVLVERILEGVLAREPASPPPLVRRALEASLDLPVCDGGRFDLRMRGLGYLSRLVEAEMFDPARAPWDELATELSGRLAAGEDWPTAATAVSSELAGREPLAKPAPDDELATSWKVPGPGGHVRHYVVAAAIAEILSGGSTDGPGALPPEVGDPAELKRCWTYGFVVRCCEEAVPPEPGSGE